MSKISRSRSADKTILGYCYQFDQTILQILRAQEGDVISIEDLEDIDVLSERPSAIQVKYLAASHYASPKTLRDPIWLMLQSFAQGKNYDYILHVYFGDGSVAPTTFTVDQLKDCLTKTKRETKETVLLYKDYTDKILSDFVARLKLRQGREYSEQQLEVYNSLATALNSTIDDVKDMHYGNALTLTQRLSMNSNVQGRRTTRADFIAAINKRDKLYDRWHREVLGEEKYIKVISKKIKHAITATRYNGLLVNASESQPELVNLCVYLATERFGEGKLHTTRPWTIILKGTDSQIKKVKLELLKVGIAFSDGYESLSFQPGIFKRPPVINVKGRSPAMDKVSYDLRVVKLESFETLVKTSYQLNSLIVLNVEDAPDACSKDDPIFISGLSPQTVKKIMEVV